MFTATADGPVPTSIVRTISPESPSNTDRVLSPSLATYIRLAALSTATAHGFDPTRILLPFEGLPPPGDASGVWAGLPSAAGLPLDAPDWAWPQARDTR